MSNEKKNPLEAMLAQYETATSKSSDNSFDKTNYFTTYLPDGIESAVKKIRILPPEEGKTPFEEVHVHSAKVDGKNRKFTCIKELNDEDCPFCEAREELLSTGEKSDEELAKKYKARLMYIVRVIDRENEDEGIKFWRFPINYKKEGIFDKIMATIGLLKEDITDPEVGRDLILNIVRVKNPRGGTYPMVNSIQAFDKGPLSADKIMAKGWLSNNKSWKEVYSVKGYDYLKIVVLGKIPMWSKKQEKFIAKEDLEAENEDSEDSNSGLEDQITMGGGSKNIDTKSTSDVKTEELTESENSYDTVAEEEDEDEEEDDLPF